MRRSPSMMRGAAWRPPIYPTIPHIWTLLLLAEGLATGADQPVRIVRGRRFGDESTDRLGPRRAGVHPPVGPAEPEPVAVVDGRLGELATERLVHRGQVRPPRR